MVKLFVNFIILSVVLYAFPQLEEFEVYKKPTKDNYKSGFRECEKSEEYAERFTCKEQLDISFTQGLLNNGYDFFSEVKNESR